MVSRRLRAGYRGRINLKIPQLPFRPEETLFNLAFYEVRPKWHYFHWRDWERCGAGEPQDSFANLSARVALKQFIVEVSRRNWIRTSTTCGKRFGGRYGNRQKACAPVPICLKIGDKDPAY